ncbi:mycothiol synthase [Phycicoccus sp. MAQZ13P-2]|uniref:mycothiol synthase n=1 Tax=Phycicoccus mangrovi TaxID=2840470 RepID=UPI001BFFE6E3|nr:mycothiol synthase [Phycicoccus mangrovi]MBT9256124.1 mycothiol synthase [Phycicoccus mangrovi]MBT9273861.1 mycothiol synthase [Phycicoccus mangrovi]
MGSTHRLDTVDGDLAARLRALWSRAEEADGVGAVSEAFRLAVGPARDGVVHLVREDGDEVAGYAQVASAGTDDAVAELVVDPAHRRAGHGRALLDAALAEGARSVWAHGDLPAAGVLAASAGLERTRELFRMARPLTSDDASDPELPDGYTARAFEPGRDDEDWVALNAAAFASHPEQGRLTVADLHERMDQDWFDAAGFILVERDGRVVAFHWTKVEPGSRSGRAHASETDEVRHGSGEVYVVGVDPAEQGHGLGGPLTRLGTAHLARRGLAEVELYVDGDNTAARRTYARLGFEDAAVDVQYTVPR